MKHLNSALTMTDKTISGFRLSLPYAPSVNRIWRRGKNCTYKDSKARSYSDVVLAERYALKPDTDLVFEGWVSVDITMHPKKPRKVAKDWIPETCRRQDVDACVKIVLDSMEYAGVYENDRQVVTVRSTVGQPMIDGGISVIVRSVPGWFDHLEQSQQSKIYYPILKDKDE